MLNITAKIKDINFDGDKIESVIFKVEPEDGKYFYYCFRDSDPHIDKDLKSLFLSVLDILTVEDLFCYACKGGLI